MNEINKRQIEKALNVEFQKAGLTPEQSYMIIEKARSHELQAQHPNSQWKTINGAKVLIDSNGEVVAGAGGALSGKGSDKKETSKSESKGTGKKDIGEHKIVLRSDTKVGGKNIAISGDNLKDIEDKIKNHKYKDFISPASVHIVHKDTQDVYDSDIDYKHGETLEQAVENAKDKVRAVIDKQSESKKESGKKDEGKKEIGKTDAISKLNNIKKKAEEFNKLEKETASIWDLAKEVKEKFPKEYEKIDQKFNEDSKDVRQENYDKAFDKLASKASPKEHANIKRKEQLEKELQNEAQKYGLTTNSSLWGSLPGDIERVKKAMTNINDDNFVNKELSKVSEKNLKSNIQSLKTTLTSDIGMVKDVRDKFAPEYVDYLKKVKEKTENFLKTHEKKTSGFKEGETVLLANPTNTLNDVAGKVIKETLKTVTVESSYGGWGGQEPTMQKIRYSKGSGDIYSWSKK